MPEGGVSAVLRIVFSVAAVFAFLFFLRYHLLRGMGRRVSDQAALLRVREQVHLGPRARLLLVELADRFFLVAMSEDAINMTEILEFKVPEPPTTGELASPSFSRQLQEILTSFRQGGKR